MGERPNLRATIPRLHALRRAPAIVARSGISCGIGEEGYHRAAFDRPGRAGRMKKGSEELPLYEYECPEHGRFEVMQKCSDAPLTQCPRCGRPVQKLLSAPAIQFKGSGWYVTDYARKSPGGDGKSDGGKDAGSKDGGSKDAASGASKTSPSG